ncbi:MAG: hypothetical protein JXA57_02425 [Armatimonadetes bacterium]|nr:hypothetical protein [Armatimonadota bacterium]
MRIICLVIAMLGLATLGFSQTPSPPPEPVQETKVGESTAADEAALSIENEFLRVRVNTGPKEAGRFAVDTTGGDPSRRADDGQVLIYGSREPWTSYTTVFVDGQPHVFGGPTERRAGLHAPTTELVAPPTVQDNELVASAVVGDLQVSQSLSFARSPTTRVRDAAAVSYIVTNRGVREHQVGLRLMVDTMLGSNDGAPLRAGTAAIETATRLIGEAIPEYWQAFDSLSDPAVISQGTLRGPGLTPPDRLEMVDWGTLADNAWDFPFPTGADFTRAGEEAKDTAVALYWEPRPLAPGESRTYTTLYGVGGVSLSPAELSLGLTAPAEVDFQYDDVKPFSVIAYVENSGGFESRGTRIELTLSEGLKLAEGSRRVSLGTLPPGQTKQVSWRVLPTGAATGTLQMVATVTSDNLEPNRVTRDLVVNSPPRLTAKLTCPKTLSVTPENRYTPNPFTIRAEIQNRGAQTGRNLVATLDLPEGLVLDGEAAITRVVDRIEPEARAEFAWTVRALGFPTGNLRFTLHASAAGAQAIKESAAVTIPELTPELRVHPAVQTVPATTDYQPTLVPVAVKLVPTRDFTGAKISLTYDPAVLDLLYVSRGEAFVDGGRLLSPWSAGRSISGRVENIGGERIDAPPLSAAEVTLFTAVFMVQQPGETDIVLEPTLLTAASDQPAFRLVNGHVTVKAQ